MTHLELFSGIGGFRRALDLLTLDGVMPFECVGYSEIDAKAKQTYQTNYNVEGETDMGDIVAFTANPATSGDTSKYFSKFIFLSFSTVLCLHVLAQPLQTNLHLLLMNLLLQYLQHPVQ